MNPALTTDLQNPVKANENSILGSSGEDSQNLSDELFSSEFTAAIEDVLAADGKLQPLTPESLDVKKLTQDIHGLDAKATIEDVSIIGNPDAEKLLTTNIINDGSSEEGILKLQTKKADLFNKSVSVDALHNSSAKKDTGIASTLNNFDSELSEYMKNLTLDDIDFKSEILIQTGRQEVNSPKWTEQSASVDKSINAINNQAVQTYSNKESSVTMMQRIEVPVQQQGWGEAVGNRLIMMVNDKMQSAHIHLNPRELGPIEVRVSVNQDQASVHFVSNNSAVRDAIDDAFPRLKEMFSQNGLTLNDANVSQQSPQQGNPNSSEQNDVSTSINNEQLELEDTATVITQSINIGLIDQYV